MRVSGLSYGGRSLADPMIGVRESQLRQITETLNALNEIFPPVSGDTLNEWAELGRRLGLLTQYESILVAAFTPELRGHWGTRIL
jgi:hypothetical protein